MDNTATLSRRNPRTQKLNNKLRKVSGRCLNESMSQDCSKKWRVKKSGINRRSGNLRCVLLKPVERTLLFRTGKLLFERKENCRCKRGTGNWKHPVKMGIQKTYSFTFISSDSEGKALVRPAAQVLVAVRKPMSLGGFKGEICGRGRGSTPHLKPW